MGGGVRFSTDDRVTVTDPKHWNYGEEGHVEEGHVEDYDYDNPGGALMYRVLLDGRRDQFGFTVDQLDFTNPEEEK
jgi:hypothetical protein